MGQSNFWRKITQQENKKIEKPAILWVVLLDFLTLLLVFLIAKWNFPDVAKSILLGGLIFFIPNTVFSWFSYRQVGANRIHNIVTNFYRAEAIKFSLTLILYCYVFWKVTPIDGFNLFLAYIVCWGVHQWGVYGLIGRYRSHAPCCDK